MEEMNMQENARLVLGLRAAGWSEKKINDFILYIETGEDQYKPEPDKEKAEQLDRNTQLGRQLKAALTTRIVYRDS